MKRRLLLVLTVSALVLTVLVSTRRFASATDPLHAAVEPTRSLEREQRELPVAESAQSSERNPVASPSPASSIAIIGRVIDLDTAQPLAASVVAAGRSVEANAHGGTFLVTLPSPATVRVTVSAPGYATRDLEVDAHGASIDLGTIALVRSKGLLVRVLDAQGKPVQGARVVAAACPPGGSWSPEDEVVLGSTDHDGVFATELAKARALWARTEARASPVILCYPDDSRVELRLLAGSGCWVGVRDAETAAPIEGCDLLLVRTSDYPHTSYRRGTGSDGLVAEPLPPGNFRVVSLTGSIKIRGMAVGSASIGRSGQACTVALSGDREQWVLATNDGGRIVAVVADDTGLLLPNSEAAFDSLEGPPAFAAPIWYRLPDVLEGAGGEIDLSRYEDLLESEAVLRVQLSAPGYEPALLEDPENAVPLNTRIEVRLTPAASRQLRLVCPDGTPYARPVWVRESESRGLILRGSPDSQGSMPPFGWSGCDLVVIGNQNPNGRVLAFVPAARLVGSNDVEVQVDASAAIEVAVEGHSASAIRCADAEQTFDGYLRDGVLVFDQLCPGSYEVGPSDVLKTISLRTVHGLDALPIRLAAGQTEHVSWHPDWSPAEALDGEVVVNGLDSDQVVVVPRFGPLDLPLTGGAGQERFDVDSEGRFRLRALSAMPSHLMFARVTREGDLVPLGWGPTGTRAIVEVACVRLEVTRNGVPAACRVTYAPAVAGRKTVALVSEHFAQEDEKVLWLPIATSQLTVTDGERFGRVNVNLVAGQQQTARVEL